jgi:DnaK suppressor protein
MARREALLKLHKRLLSRRTGLRRLLAGEIDSLKGHRASPAGDAFDAAFDSGRDEVTSQLVEIEGRELDLLERAIRKIEQGTYGHCENCEKRIPVARLNALPYSVLCIDCQREMERTGLGDRAGGRGDWSRVEDDSLRDRNVSLNDLEIESAGR